MGRRAGRYPIAARLPARTLVVAAAVVVAAVNFLWQLGSSSLFVDEVYSWADATTPFGGLIDQVRQNEVTPPTYFAALRGWILGVNAEADWAMRLPSAICAILLVPLLYDLGRRVASESAGIAAAFLGALSPLVLDYAQQVRTYAPSMLVCALAAGCAVRGGRREGAGGPSFPPFPYFDRGTWQQCWSSARSHSLAARRPDSPSLGRAPPRQASASPYSCQMTLPALLTRPSRGRRDALALAIVFALVLGPGVPSASAGDWLAGDLHVHTTYSHDSYGGPADDNTGLDDANTYGLTVAEEFSLASTRGLDYVAITDHNDIRSQSDPGFGTQGVIGVPGYENSLKTHAQMLGATRLYENGDKGLEATRSVADSLREDGGVFQVNHPSSPDWAFRYEVPAETSEVWNLPWYYQPPFPAAADNDRALAFWQGWLDTGAKVAAVGGSDSHWAATASVQGVGQPTTWVYASEPTPAGVLAGLRAGHTFISHQPPAYAGPQIFLEADGDRDGTYEAMVGDTVAPGSPLRVRVRGGSGGFLRIVTDAGRDATDPVEVTSSEFEHRFVVPPDASWVHVQLYGEDQPVGREAGCTAIPSDDLAGSFTYCTNRIVMLALTSAIFLRAPEPVDSGSLAARPVDPALDVRVKSPRLASDSSRGRNIRVRIGGKKGLPSISHLVLQYRRTGRGTNRTYATLHPRLAKSTTRVQFKKGKIGETYLFRITAIGADGKRSAFHHARTVFPYDEQGRGRRFSRGWRRTNHKRAWLGGYTQTSRRGATLNFATKAGGRIFLIARTGPRGGKAAFGRGPRKKVVSFRTRRWSNRQVVAIVNRTDKGIYRFRLQVLRGEVMIDGIAVRRR